VTNLEDFKKAISQYHHLISLNLVVRRGPYAYSITLPFWSFFCSATLHAEKMQERVPLRHGPGM